MYRTSFLHRYSILREFRNHDGYFIFCEKYPERDRWLVIHHTGLVVIQIKFRDFTSAVDFLFSKGCVYFEND